MRLSDSILLRALREPAGMKGYDPETWDLLVRQAHGAGLLGRLGALVRAHGLDNALPKSVLRHLHAMLSIADRQRTAVHWEVHHLADAMEGIQGRVLLLKGAAYAAANLPPAEGRTFSDIDILVPKRLLPEVELRLTVAGWVTTHRDSYDQRYYRKWMHELPPMFHLERETSLDVHHGILPETARIRTRPDLIIEAALPLPGYGNIYIPCQADQILHSATHLFHEGEWWHGLRDLSDLDCLLRSYGCLPDFWATLLARARALNLLGPLGYALRLTRTLLDTPIPVEMLKLTRSSFRRSFMDALFRHGMGAAHHSLATPLTRPSEFLLYIRSHWLKMPLHLLLPHLLYKATRKEEIA